MRRAPCEGSRSAKIEDAPAEAFGVEEAPVLEENSGEEDSAVEEGSAEDKDSAAEEDSVAAEVSVAEEAEELFVSFDPGLRETWVKKAGTTSQQSALLGFVERI